MASSSLIRSRSRTVLIPFVVGPIVAAVRVVVTHRYELLAGLFAFTFLFTFGWLPPLAPCLRSRRLYRAAHSDSSCRASEVTPVFVVLWVLVFPAGRFANAGSYLLPAVSLF